MRLQPVAPQSLVKHSTTEPLRSHNLLVVLCWFLKIYICIWKIHTNQLEISCILTLYSINAFWHLWNIVHLKIFWKMEHLLFWSKCSIFHNIFKSTVKPVWSGHSKIDKTKVLKTNGSLMKVESIAECSLGAFCNTFDLHLVIIGLENTFWSSFWVAA